MKSIIQSKKAINIRDGGWPESEVYVSIGEKHILTLRGTTTKDLNINEVGLYVDELAPFLRYNAPDYAVPNITAPRQLKRGR